MSRPSLIAFLLKAQDATAEASDALCEARSHPYDRSGITEAQARYDAARAVERAALELL